MSTGHSSCPASPLLQTVSYRPTRFRRNFTLSNELEPDKISAEMKDGVLTLNVPKHAEHQPRKIEIRTG